MNHFHEITFNERYHSYTMRGKRMTSVTKYVSQFKRPFDRDYWSKKKADEAGIPQAEMLARWDAKAEKSRRLGTAVHTHIQNVFEGQTPADDPFLSLNELPQQARVFDGLWRERLAKTITPYKWEWVIGDYELGIAGTVDAIVKHNDTGRYHIFDWKTNQEFTTRNAWGKRLLPIFDHLDECDLNYYSLQVSLYWLILDRNTTLQIDGAYIVHLAEDGYHIHKAVDLRGALIEALTTGKSDD